MNEKPSYSELQRERERILERLGDYPPVLRGSLRRHGNKCGNPNCACHDLHKPKRHGPYYYLSHRYQDRTQTLFLSPVKLPYAKAWMANYKRLIHLIYRLSEVNFRLLRYHALKLGDGIEKN
jgi:hypothetical protein